MIGRGPRADHVDCRLAACRVEAAAERFSINGDYLSVRDFMQRCDPTEQALLELCRFDCRKNLVEPVVRRDPVS
jgi:hypothetical protein